VASLACRQSCGFCCCRQALQLNCLNKAFDLIEVAHFCFKEDHQSHLNRRPVARRDFCHPDGAGDVPCHIAYQKSVRRSFRIAVPTSAFPPGFCRLDFE